MINRTTPILKNRKFYKYVQQYTSFCCIQPLSSNSRYKSKNDADEAVFVVFLVSSSGGYINGRNCANLELLIDKTSSIYLYVKLKVLASCMFLIYQLLLHMVFTSRNWFAMQGLVAIILNSWNVIFIWETGYWTRDIKRFALFDLLKGLYSDTKILSHIDKKNIFDIFVETLSLYIFTIWKSIVYNLFCRDGIYFDKILVSEYKKGGGLAL
jgi:hypothetical protein